jgi:hypothetical protein
MTWLRDMILEHNANIRDPLCECGHPRSEQMVRRSAIAATASTPMRATRFYVRATNCASRRTDRGFIGSHQEMTCSTYPK